MAKTKLIALSAGGDDTELAAEGIGIQHVEELMIRVATRLLSEGHYLAFGGTLNVEGKDLTRYLIDTAHRWTEEGDTRSIDVNDPKTWPLVNYAAWPHYESISREQRARLVGLCHFIDIDAASATPDKLRKELSEGMRARIGADALSEMRCRMADETAMRIVWGGKIEGSSGWMAGILEEVAYTLEAGKPIFILGGWGGVSKLIASYLLEKDADWPEKLSLGACANPERDKEMSAREWEEKNDRMQQVKSLLTEYRSKLHNRETIHACSTKQILDLMRETNARRAMNAISELVADLS